MDDDDVYVYLDQVFERDRMKAARNAIKHNVRFPEAASVFFDENALFEADPDHSADESSVFCSWVFGSFQGAACGACASR